MVGPWAYGVFEGRHVDRWLASRAGWRADVLRGRTELRPFAERCGREENASARGVNSRYDSYNRRRELVVPLFRLR